MEGSDISVGQKELDGTASPGFTSGGLVDLFGVLDKLYNWCGLLQVELIRALNLVGRVLSDQVDDGGRVQRVTGATAELICGPRGYAGLRMVFSVSPVPFNRWFRTDPSRPWTVQLDVEVRQMWRELVEEALAGLGDAGLFPIGKASVHFTFRRRRRVDADAFDYTVKYVLDALVERGVLSGDACDGVKYSVEVVPSEVEGVEVVVYPQ